MVCTSLTVLGKGEGVHCNNSTGERRGCALNNSTGERRECALNNSTGERRGCSLTRVNESTAGADASVEALKLYHMLSLQ